MTLPLSLRQDPILSLLALAKVEDPTAQGFQSDHFPSEPTSFSFPFYLRQALCSTFPARRWEMEARGFRCPEGFTAGQPDGDRGFAGLSPINPPVLLCRWQLVPTAWISFSEMNPWPTRLAHIFSDGDTCLRVVLCRVLQAQKHDSCPEPSGTETKAPTLATS